MKNKKEKHKISAFGQNKAGGAFFEKIYVVRNFSFFTIIDYRRPKFNRKKYARFIAKCPGTGYSF